MGDTSVGPAESRPASESKERAALENIDAQRANEADTQAGQAGIEAKPFAATNEKKVASHRPGDSEMAPDEPNDMISERRNPGRDDARKDGGQVPERDH